MRNNGELGVLCEKSRSLCSGGTAEAGGDDQAEYKRESVSARPGRGAGAGRDGRRGKLRLYPEPDCGMLVDAIAEYYGIESGEVFVGVGSDDVLAMIFLTFFNSPKPILFPDITYSFYDVWADMLRIPYEARALDDDFCICKEDYYGENGGVIFPNPNAPTGLLLGLSEVEDIVAHNRDSRCGCG